ncbi:MAG: antibiotic biosynthesis monooxygenase [Taibaiella sp.]|nr:antibiotic biosynthesis monooxygenase [Taibaiella sp.]
MITNVIRIKPFSDKEEATLDWMQQMAAKAAAMPGYLKTEIVETNRRVAEKEFLTILQFDNKANLLVWENDVSRKEQMEWAAVNLAQINNTSLFEEFGVYAASSPVEQQHPNRFKVYLLAVGVIFTLISTLAQYVLMPLGKFLGTPPLLIIFLNVATLVAIVSFVVMPFLTKRLYKYLV